MATIANALDALGLTLWHLDGDPQNEAEFNASFRKITGDDGNGTLFFSTDPSDFGVTWAQVKSKYDEMAAEEPMNELRAARDKLIAETDWWASSDLTMTDEQTAYRQALRDITSNYSSLDDVVWPTKP